MVVPAPPYALAPTPFPLPALAAYAGRAALGGDREVGLACFVVARLAAALLPPHALPTELREKRVIACRAWLVSQALPSAVRGHLLLAAESTALAERFAIVDALRALRAHAAKYLDTAAVNELDSVATKLAG